MRSRRVVQNGPSVFLFIVGVGDEARFVGEIQQGSGLQAHADKEAGVVFVLVDDDVVVVEQGVADDGGESCEVAGGEVADDGYTLVEDHVGELGAYLLLFAVDGDVASVEDDDGGEQRDVEEPLVADDEVVGIATANAEMADVDACLWNVGWGVVRGFYHFALKGESCQPGTCRAALNVRLGKGCRDGEAAVVEGVVARHGEYLLIDVALLDVVFVLLFDVAGEGLGTLVAGIDAITVGIGVDVQLVVFVATAETGGVDGQ